MLSHRKKVLCWCHGSEKCFVRMGKVGLEVSEHLRPRFDPQNRK